MKIKLYYPPTGDSYSYEQSGDVDYGKMQIEAQRLARKIFRDHFSGVASACENEEVVKDYENILNGICASFGKD